MLKSNPLKEAIVAGRPVFGIMNSMPSALMVEMIGYAGFDFVVIDREHVCADLETLEHAVRAAECAGIPALVRVPSIEEIPRALDCGAYGIIAPRVRSRAEAERVAQASRYHPRGHRGITGGRTTGFGRIPLASYVAKANDEVLVVAMIEDREAVEQIDDIVSVPGIDVILEGAIDLSQSYGVPAQANHPQVQEAIGAMFESCRRHGKAFCAIPREPGAVKSWLERGARMFLSGDDRGVAFRALKAHAESLKGA